MMLRKCFHIYLCFVILFYLNVSHIISGFIFHLGILFDSFDKYKSIRDFELEVVTELPDFDTWDGVKSHERGEIHILYISG